MLASRSTVERAEPEHLRVGGDSHLLPLSFREVIWRGAERRERLRVYGPLYRSGYLNALVAGRLEDGGDFAVVVGTHTRNYPYFHPRSRWDDFLLVAGKERLLAAGRRLTSLALALGPEQRASIVYHGRVLRPSGAAVDVDLHLDLSATLYAPRAEGIGIRIALLGLQWQPAFVTGSGSLTIDGVRRRVSDAAGVMERGSLTNLRSRFFHFAYDYFAVTRAGTPPAAHVRFATRPLYTGFYGLPLRALLAGPIATENVTLGAPRLQHGDRHGLAPAAEERIEAVQGHRLNLGPAILTRELVRIGEGARGRYGLREAFEPRNAQVTPKQHY